MNKKIVLASGSPRRKALLQDLGIDLEVRISEAEEINEGSPEQVVSYNARIKCEAVAKNAHSSEIIIAADTIVVHENTILGKPHSTDEALQMLKKLSGSTHKVMTGLHIHNISDGKQTNEIETTSVTFRHLTQKEIERFVEIVHPLDRAGAYTVDGPGSLLVKSYHGCYYNVLGLPVVLLHKLLLNFQYDFFTAMDSKNTRFL